MTRQSNAPLLSRKHADAEVRHSASYDRSTASRRPTLLAHAGAAPPLTSSSGRPPPQVPELLSLHKPCPALRFPSRVGKSGRRRHQRRLPQAISNTTPTNSVFVSTIIRVLDDLQLGRLNDLHHLLAQLGSRRQRIKSLLRPHREILLRFNLAARR